MKLKQILLIILCLLLLTNTSNAAFIPVNKENLNNALQNFINSDINQNNLNVSSAKVVSDDKISFNLSKNVNIDATYNLDSKPNITISVPVKNGMSYDECQVQTTLVYLIPVTFYSAIANIQGINFNDSFAYYCNITVFSALEKLNSSKGKKYTIYDDRGLADGVVVDKSDSDSTIYTSEFENRVMDYINDNFEEKNTLSDYSNGLNTFELTVEKKDVTDNSCNLVANLVVNPNADFSQLNNYESDIKDSFTDDTNNSYEDEAYQDNQNTLENNDNTEVINNEDTTKSKGQLPKAGVLSSVLILLILICMIFIILILRKLLTKYKEVK